MVDCGLLDKALIYCSSPQTPRLIRSHPQRAGCDAAVTESALVFSSRSRLTTHPSWYFRVIRSDGITCDRRSGGVQALGQRNGRIGATGVMNGRRDEEWSGVIQVGRGQTDSEWRRRRRMDGRSSSDADSAERFVLPHTQFVSCRRPLSASRVRTTSISRKTF